MDFPKTAAAAIAALALASASLCGCNQAATEAAALEELPGDSLKKQIDDAYKAGEKRVAIKPGIYRLDCPEKETWHIRLSKMENFEIDATGSTIVFNTRDKRGMGFQHCKNMTLKGATFLRETPPFSQGDIETIAADRKSVDVKVHDGYPADIDDDRYFFKTPVLTIFRPSDGKLKDNVPDLYIASFERLGERLFRFKLREPVDARIPLALGDMAAWRGSNPNGLCGHEIDLHYCAGVTFTGVTLKSARGIAVCEFSGEGGNRYNYSLEYANPPKGASKAPLLTASADGFHSACVRKGPILENCVLQGCHDDGVNIHGAFGMAIETQGSTLIANSPIGGSFCLPGDKLEFYNSDCQPIGKAVVKSFSELKNYEPKAPARAPNRHFKDSKPFYVKIELDREVSVKPSDFISNSDAVGSGFEIRNCVTKDHRAHGIFIRASNGKIENCTLERIHMGGIVIAPEFLSWNESSYAKDLLVKGNVIRKTAIATQPWNCALTVAAWEDKFIALPGGHSKIRVEGNRFENNDGVNVIITTATGVTLKDNVFVNPMQAPSWHGSEFGVDHSALVWATQAKELELEGNRAVNPGPCMKATMTATDSASGTGFQSIEVER